MAMSVWPSRQARPAVSVTTTPTVRPVQLGEPPPDGAGRGVGVDGQQHDVARARRWRRRPRRPPSSARDGCARWSSDRAGPPPAPSRPRPHPHASPAAHPALGLGDHLAGHRDDVPVGSPSSGRRPQQGDQHRRQVVARGHLGGAVRRPHRQLHRPARDTSSTAAAAIAAVASRSVISSGTARQARPGVDHASYVVRVGLVDQPAVEHAALGAGAVVQADRRRR